MRPAKAFLFHRQNEDGLCPVKLYVRIKGTVIRPNLGVLVHPDDWDEERGLVRGRSNEAKRKNLIIANRVAAANKVLSTYELMEEPLTRETFLDEWRNPMSKQDFLEFYRVNMQRNYDRGVIKKGTLSLEERTYRKLYTWSNGSIPFSKVSRAWLEEFDAWHAAYLRQRGYDGVGQRERCLKHIKKYLLAAKNQDDSRYNFKWPFHGFKWPRHTSQPVFLVDEEVRILIELYQNPEMIAERIGRLSGLDGLTEEELESKARSGPVEKMQRCIRWFLFQCMTGARYSDLAQLTWKNIQGDYLVYTPIKTETTSGKSVKQILSPQARELILAPAEDCVNPRIERLHYDLISNQKYNDDLKVVAQIAGIDKRITTHVARHTFATSCLRNGVSLPYLQDMMGVASMKTLMVYVHIIQEQSDQELLNAINIISGNES